MIGYVNRFTQRGRAVIIFSTEKTKLFKLFNFNTDYITLYFIFVCNTWIVIDITHLTVSMEHPTKMYYPKKLFFLQRT